MSKEESSRTGTDDPWRISSCQVTGTKTTGKRLIKQKIRGRVSGAGSKAEVRRQNESQGTEQKAEEQESGDRIETRSQKTGVRIQNRRTRKNRRKVPKT